MSWPNAYAARRFLTQPLSPQARQQSPCGRGQQASQMIADFDVVAARIPPYATNPESAA